MRGFPLWISVLYVLSSYICVGWVYLGILLRFARHYGVRSFRGKSVISRIKGELQPLYWPATVVVTMVTIFTPDTTPSGWIATVLSLTLAWFLCKNDGDDNDRWEKRLKNLRDSVAVLGHRLAVVST